MSEKWTSEHLLRELSEFWQCGLENSSEGQEYLLRRGITTEVARRFSLGYADFARSPRPGVYVKEDEVAMQLNRDLGLLTKDDHDKFHQRIMIPLLSIDGRQVGFTSRATRDDSNGKFPRYLRTRMPDGVEASDMALTFYSQSRNAIEQAGSMIVVEGVFDALALQSVGFRNAIALQGAEKASSWGALQQIAHEGKTKIVLMFDADHAGAKARESAIANLLPEARDSSQIRFANQVQGHKDAAEVFEALGQERASQSIMKNISAAHGVQEEVAALLSGARSIEEQVNLCDQLQKIVNTCCDRDCGSWTEINDATERVLGVSMREMQLEPEPAHVER